METFSHNLKEPRRKKCRVDAIGSELPILSGDKNRVCKGRLGDGRVLVDDWEDIKHLYCNVSRMISYNFGLVQFI